MFVTRNRCAALAALVSLVLATVGSSPAAAGGPAAPTPLTPANAASVTVPFTISWSAVTDPSGINAYNWQVSPASSFVPVVEQGSTSGQTQATVSGLTNGTYFWRVQAVNGAFVQGAWSGPRSFTVTGANAGAPGSPTLGPPKGATAFHPMETIYFTWSAVAGAASYIFDASNDPNFPVATKVHFDNIANTNYGLTLGDSMPQGTWYARVQAVNASGIAGVPSNVDTFTLSFNAPLPPAPTPLAPADGATIALPLAFSWTDVPNPQLSGYTLEVATDPGFSNIEFLNNQITGPHWTVTSLTAGTKYWRVNSMQGDAAPATATSSATPALTAWSTTRSFIVPSTPTVASVSLSTAAPFSGDTETVTIQLTAPAPAGGAVVSLTSSNPTAAPVPATFSMPAPGQAPASGWFQFQAGQVTAATPVTLTASLNGTSASASLTVQPPSVKALSVFSPITGGALTSAVVTLNGLAPAAGLDVALTSSSPAATPPTPAHVPPGSGSASVNVPTSQVSANTPVTLSASAGGVTVQAPLTVTPQQPPASLALSPTSTSGTAGSSGTVTLASPAPTDTQVFLSSSNPAMASVPSTVQVPQGSLTGGFSVNTSGTSPATVTISASGAGVTRTATLTLNSAAAPPGPTVSAVTLNPSTVAASSSSQGTVTLSAAPSAATPVTLSSGNTAANVPASVTVAAGSTSATFPVTTGFVSGTTTVLISASLGGTSQSAALTITQQPASASADSVAIQTAEYVVKDQILNVQATSSSTSASLSAYDGSSGALIGSLTNTGGGKYQGQLSWPSTPSTVTVKSSLGGSATSAVTPK